MYSGLRALGFGLVGSSLALGAVILPANSSSGQPHVERASSADPYAAAISHPVRDDMYPSYGSTIVDALHYGLRLRWEPRSRTLEGSEKLTFRAARSVKKSFGLDMSQHLQVTSATLDGHRVRVSRYSHKLHVHHSLHAASRHVLALHYDGVPQEVVLETTRQGAMPLGWMTTRSGEAYALQEPYGAFTWFAANDQPSDKALYDFTINAPRKWVGVANGELESRTVRDHRTITRWHLGVPASSYLATIGIGPYKETIDHSIPGLPITYWTDRSRPGDLRKVRYTATALRWLEDKLGPYPFHTLGILVAPAGGMETETMVTLGRDPYTLSHDVIVHELAHQWFGDEVSPLRWHDGWLNEGWATYMAEATWSSHGDSSGLDQILAEWNDEAAELRKRGGPPATPYASSAFDDNIYLIPALMWDLVRQRLGDTLFWKLAAAWPRDHRFGNADYATAVAWWNAESGQDLTSLFGSWLLGKNQPTWTPPSGPVPTHAPLRRERRTPLRLY